MMHDDLIVFF